MPSFGGLAPFARRFGGEPRTLEAILRSLNDQMGTALDVSTSSPVYMRNLALARAIADVWDRSQALSNQFDWNRVTEFLPRWESIFAIYPRSGATTLERRQALATRWATIGKPCTHQALVDALATPLDGITYTVEVQTVDGGAAVHWPYAYGPVQNVDGGPAITLTATQAAVAQEYFIRLRISLGGVRGVAEFEYSLDGGATWAGPIVTNSLATIGATGITAICDTGTYVLNDRYWAHSCRSNGEWAADTARVAIVCPKPSTMNEAEYASRLSAAYDSADRYVPAWVEIDFVRDGSHGAGFYLDELPNLSAQRFD